ncbi:hypothetical protein KsCSTR_45060 [Candidatus Kuenenia stuttgartiensis]|uniref:Uncharacterized protein n=1 Tax=Kuenenia stuttgartiensis TaxID=174633 RepID=A0A6G7GWJ1_KUEST|nr:hypothetical protein KsCSTR_45060 [Candidatus Kuenenia stuttgartiensis]
MSQPHDWFTFFQIVLYLPVASITNKKANQAKNYNAFIVRELIPVNRVHYTILV